MRLLKRRDAFRCTTSRIQQADSLYTVETIDCGIWQRILGEELAVKDAICRCFPGREIVVSLVRQLTVECGCVFAEVFLDEKIVATMSRQLSLSHFRELLPTILPRQSISYTNKGNEVVEWPSSDHRKAFPDVKRFSVETLEIHACLRYRLPRRCNCAASCCTNSMVPQQHTTPMRTVSIAYFRFEDIPGSTSNAAPYPMLSGFDPASIKPGRSPDFRMKG